MPDFPEWMKNWKPSQPERIKDPQVRKLVREVIKCYKKGMVAHVRMPEPTEDYLLAERPVCDVEPFPQEWLWPGRIPLGSVTLIAGDEGVGKSLVALDIAARVTRGSSWPDAPDEPQDEGNVLILAAYDPLLGTAMQRFLQAGNNLERTF